MSLTRYDLNELKNIDINVSSLDNSNVSSLDNSNVSSLDNSNVSSLDNSNTITYDNSNTTTYDNYHNPNNFQINNNNKKNVVIIITSFIILLIILDVSLGISISKYECRKLLHSTTDSYFQILIVFSCLLNVSFILYWFCLRFFLNDCYSFMAWVCYIFIVVFIFLMFLCVMVYYQIFYSTIVFSNCNLFMWGIICYISFFILMCFCLLINYISKG